MWTVLAVGGAPMREASLCAAHHEATEHDYLTDAQSAEDWGGAGWTRISDDTAAYNDIRCVECTLEGRVR